MRKFLLFFAFICSLWAVAQEKKLVYLENANELSFDSKRSNDYQILRGNVRFRHDDAIMNCDSAYFYDKVNSFDAFGHVVINQGDTLHIYGDYLRYDGNNQVAALRKNIRMVNRSITLTTDSFNYDRGQNIAYYFGGGKLEDASNTLTSSRGQYFPSSKVSVFKKDVHLNNEKMDLFTDTLRYNTQTAVATILGPSHIYHDSIYIYSENGWYDTKNELSELKYKSFIRNKDGMYMTGDLLKYNQQTNIAKGYDRVELRDSANYISIKGDEMVFYEKEKHGFVTKNVLITEFSSTDSLYFHSDSVFYSTTIDTLENVEYSNVDAYYNVRFYRSDMQGKCDSIHYSTQDSIMEMYNEPLLWSEENQLSGNFIKIFMKGKSLDRIFIEGNSFIVSQEKIDTTKFNQISGKQITAYADDGKLRKILVDGNAQSLYYASEEDGSYVGGNRAESSYLTIYMNSNGKLDRIVMTPASEGTFSPLEKLNPEDLFLNGFEWFEDVRPKQKDDIFLIYKKPKKTSVEVKREVKKSRKKQVGYQVEEDK